MDGEAASCDRWPTCTDTTDTTRTTGTDNAERTCYAGEFRRPGNHCGSSNTSPTPAPRSAASANRTGAADNLGCPGPPTAADK